MNKLKLSLSVQLGLVLILWVKSRCQIASLLYTSFWSILVRVLLLVLDCGSERGKTKSTPSLRPKSGVWQNSMTCCWSIYIAFFVTTVFGVIFYEFRCLFQLGKNLDLIRKHLASKPLPPNHISIISIFVQTPIPQMCLQRFLEYVVFSYSFVSLIKCTGILFLSIYSPNDRTWLTFFTFFKTTTTTTTATKT